MDKHSILILAAALAAVSAAAQAYGPPSVPDSLPSPPDTTAAVSVSLRDAGGGVEMPEVFPKSPEAAAFLRYGYGEPSEYTGDPGIRLPLYTISGHGLHIPLTLTYSPDIGVSQEASWVGLGWDLCVGGSITYVPSGGVDTRNPLSTWPQIDSLLASHAEPPYTEYTDSLPRLYTLRQELLSGLGERDFFSLNAPGVSLLFTYDPETGRTSAIGADGDQYLIESHGHTGWSDIDDAHWRVRCPDGTVMEFAPGERRPSPDPPGFHTSTWLLERVASPVGAIADFAYTTGQLSPLPTLLEAEELSVPGEGSSSGPAYPGGQSASLSWQETSLGARWPSSVTTHDTQVLFHTSPRTDYPGALRLDSVTVHSLPDGGILSRHLFRYSTFAHVIVGGTIPGFPATPATETRLGDRLRLDAVAAVGGTDTLATSFLYDATPLPLKTSYARDFWGHYNGRENLTGTDTRTLLPSPSSLRTPYGFPEASFDGTYADRRCRTPYATAATLRRVTFPTGGYAEYAFEPHTFAAPPDSDPAPDPAVPATYTVTTDTLHPSVPNHHPFTVAVRSQCTLSAVFHGDLAALPGSVTLYAMSGGIAPVSLSLAGVPQDVLSSRDTYTVSRTLTLEACDYMVVAGCPSSAPGFVDGHVTVTPPPLSSCTGGGLRTASVTLHGADGAVLSSRRYGYTLPGGGTSGRLMRPFRHARLRDVIVVAYDVGAAVALRQVATLRSQAVGAPSFTSCMAHATVGYARVTAAECGPSGDTLRTETLSFRCDAPLFRSEGVWAFDGAGNGSLLARTVRDASGDTLLTETYAYETTLTRDLRCNAAVEDRFTGTAFEYVPEGYWPRFTIRRYPLRAWWHRPSSVTRTERTPSGTLATATLYGWNAVNHRPSEIEERSPDGTSTVRRYLYPADMPEGVLALMADSAHFRRADVAEERVLRVASGDTATVMVRRPAYAMTPWQADINGGWRFLPASEAYSFSGAAPETRLTYGYDIYGNLRSAVRDGAEKAVWLWSYGWRHPVAEIRGADWSQVAAWVGTTLIDTLGDAASAPAVQSALAAVRGKLSSRPVTVATLTWRPGMGPLTVTTPDSLVTRYGYDAMGRLTTVGDHHGSAVATYAYRYACQDPPHAPGGNSIQATTFLNAGGTAFTTAYTYHDGLGRPVETASDALGDGTAFLHAATLYDALGRDSLATLPAPLTADGAFQGTGTLLAVLPSHYGGDARPWQEKDHDALDRPLSVTGPGQAWSGHPSTSAYGTNAAGEVPRYTVCETSGGTAPTVARQGYWPACSLRKTTETDGDGRAAVTYADTEGRTVMTCTAAGDTRYVYDLPGRLRAVLPPAVGVDADGREVERYGYLYSYDARNRLTSKTLPDGVAYAYGYDSADRLFAVQDAAQRAAGRMEFRLYDASGRQVVRGSCSASLAACGSSPASATYTGAGPFAGYATPVPLDSVRLMEVDYYDGYAFLALLPDSVAALLAFDAAGGAAHTNGKGRRTGGRTYLAEGAPPTDGAAPFEAAACYYDGKGRLTQSHYAGGLRGVRRETTAYTFTGKPAEKTVVHRKDASSPEITETYTYTYDHADRLLSVTHSVNGSAPVTLAAYTYDALGRTAAKTIGGIETVSYTYNIQSWPTKMQSPKFTELMAYEGTANGITPSTPQWSGRIAAQRWYHGNPTIKPLYQFAYDAAGRLTSATYSQNVYMQGFAYDAMGNITSLTRQGFLYSTTWGDIDDLVMEYEGNRMVKCDDAAASQPTYSEAHHFADLADTTTEYEYDQNGNMTKDLNRKISSIQYNSLNLPEKTIILGDGMRTHIDNTYDAAGNKLRTTIGRQRVIGPFHPSSLGGVAEPQGGGLTPGIVDPIPSSNIITTDYCGNAVYRDGGLSMLLTEEGYVTFTNDTTPVYHYYLKDHLGSIRVVFDQSGAVEQRNDYYGTLQPYKFGGKELQRDAGLDEYDFGARWMDPVIGGRFTTMDPLAEKYYGVSPYAYCHGDPVNKVDPTGEDDYYSISGRYLGSDNQQTDHIMISFLPFYDQNITPIISKPIEQFNLEPQEYSNIFTDIVSRHGEMDLSIIHNSKISVTTIQKQDNFYSLFTYNDASVRLGSIASTIRKDNDNIITVFIFQDYGHSEEKAIFTTVSNVINVLVGHEYNGHIINAYTDNDKNHHLVFESQMKHHSWSKTTEAFKQYEKEVYEKVKKREQ